MKKLLKFSELYEPTKGSTGERDFIAKHKLTVVTDPEEKENLEKTTNKKPKAGTPADVKPEVTEETEIGKYREKTPGKYPGVKHFEHPNGSFVQATDDGFVHFDVNTSKKQKFNTYEELKSHIDKKHEVKKEVKKEVKEETLNELSHDKLKKYSDEAEKNDVSGKDSEDVYRKLNNRMKYTEKAKEKIKEELETLNEISKKLIGKYIKHAKDDMERSAFNRAIHLVNKHDDEYNAGLKKNIKRSQMFNKAVNRLTKEELESLDEISKSTLGSYIKRASQDVSHTSRELGSKDATGQNSSKEESKVAKRLKGIAKAVNKSKYSDRSKNYINKAAKDLDDTSYSQGHEDVKSDGAFDYTKRHIKKKLSGISRSVDRETK